MVTNNITRSKEFVFSGSQNLPSNWESAIFFCLENKNLCRLAQEIETRLPNRNHQSLKKYPRPLQDAIVNFLAEAEKIGINCLGYPEKRIVTDLICRVADVSSKERTYEEVVQEMTIQNTEPGIRILDTEELGPTLSALKGEVSDRTHKILQSTHHTWDQVVEIAEIINEWSTALWNQSSSDNGFGDAWHNDSLAQNSAEHPTVGHMKYIKKLLKAGLNKDSIRYVYSKLVDNRNVSFFDNDYLKIQKRKEELRKEKITAA